MSACDFDNLLSMLTTHQHLWPHEPVNTSLARAVDELGLCPAAVADSLAWLQLDAAKSIGRLRRTELMQLARTLHRYWLQRTAAATTAQSQP